MMAIFFVQECLGFTLGHNASLFDLIPIRYVFDLAQWRINIGVELIDSAGRIFNRRAHIANCPHGRSELPINQQRRRRSDVRPFRCIGIVCDESHRHRAANTLRIFGEVNAGSPSHN